MRRLTHLIVLVAFVFSCGGNWAVFQCVAWANMIREYSEVVPVTQAIQMTFSGEYPCALCKAIAEKKNSEKQQALGFEKHDKNFLLPIAIRSFVLASSPVIYSEPVKSLHFRSEPPSVPPPRTALI